ncbi:MAG: four-carbon acid sugar kinase family protein [Merdibacter sp.]
MAKSGARVIMCNEIPGKMTADFDALVVALKSRSAAKEEALAQSGQALQFLREQGCEQFYFKYCSTFDSTPQGNIGVVMDALMEALDVPYSLLCPSLPVNGRTVLNGILYVNGQPLSESPMKDHPLNPMWDSEIANLMRPQSHFPCEVMSREQMKTEWIEQLKQKHAKERFYLIPDYETDADGEQIASLFGDLPLLSGGSGLLEYCTGANDMRMKMQRRPSIVRSCCVPAVLRRQRTRCMRIRRAGIPALPSMPVRCSMAHWMRIPCSPG